MATIVEIFPTIFSGQAHTPFGGPDIWILGATQDVITGHKGGWQITGYDFDLSPIPTGKIITQIKSRIYVNTAASPGFTKLKISSPGAGNPINNTVYADSRDFHEDVYLDAGIIYPAYNDYGFDPIPFGGSGSDPPAPSPGYREHILTGTAIADLQAAVDGSLAWSVAWSENDYEVYQAWWDSMLTFLVDRRPRFLVTYEEPPSGITDRKFSRLFSGRFGREFS